MEISKDKKTAIVLGGEGFVGKHLINLLLEHQAYSSVKILGTKPMGVSSPKMEEYAINFDQIEKFAKHFTGNDLFCCIVGCDTPNGES